MLFDLLLMLSVLLWQLRLAQQGVLTVESVALVLVAVAGLAAVVRSSGMNLARLAFRIGTPIASLLTFLSLNTDGSSEQMTALLWPILAILIAMFGTYVMFGGVSRRTRR